MSSLEKKNTIFFNSFLINNDKICQKLKNKNFEQNEYDYAYFKKKYKTFDDKTIQFLLKCNRIKTHDETNKFKIEYRKIIIYFD